MGVAPAMQVGELWSREPVGVRSLDVFLTEWRAEPIERLDDARGEQMHRLARHLRHQPPALAEARDLQPFDFKRRFVAREKHHGLEQLRFVHIGPQAEGRHDHRMKSEAARNGGVKCYI